MRENFYASFLSKTNLDSVIYLYLFNMFEDAKTGFMILFLWCPFKNVKPQNILTREFITKDGLDPLLYI